MRVGEERVREGLGGKGRLGREGMVKDGEKVEEKAER